MQPDAFLILCTAPAHGDTAVRLARGLVEMRLAACVNIIPSIRSIYRFEGEIHDDAEVQLLIKTRPDCFESVAAWISEHHPYDVPEVIALPVTGAAPAYLHWLLEQTSP